MKAIITVGISASGKSTFAEELVKRGFVNVNRDNVRRSIAERNGGKFTWAKWNWGMEGKVTDIIQDQISAAHEAGKDIILSDTNLHAGRREGMISRLKAHGYDVEIKDFPISLEEAWSRDAARKDGVGVSVIAKQYEQWLDYIGRKRYVADVTKPRCILVDIDGTLAHMNGKRGAFEWDKVGLDDVDVHVRTFVNFASNIGSVIVLSGRDGVCEDKTRDWLNDGGVMFDYLFMRTPNDMRKDTIVKEEIFWRDIADNYNVQFVIDDRPSVCRMWRELGLKVFQVGNVHIEF